MNPTNTNWAVNSLRPSDAYMREYNIPTLLRLFGTKPVSEPMLAYCQIDPKANIPVKFQILKVFIQETALDNVVREMGTVTSQNID